MPQFVFIHWGAHHPMYRKEPGCCSTAHYAGAQWWLLDTEAGYADPEILTTLFPVCDPQEVSKWQTQHTGRTDEGYARCGMPKCAKASGSIVDYVDYDG